MKLKLFCIPFLLGLIASCDDCTDCEPIMNDPAFQIEIYAKSTEKTARARLDSVNGVRGIKLNEDYKDPATLFRIPLNAGSDTSQFALTLTEFTVDIPDTVQFERNLTVAYERETRADNGEIRVRAFNFKVIDHSFDSLALVYANSLQISNETKIKLYF